MSTLNRPIVLSIAGFDPTGGAGLLADIKTVGDLGCYGLAVNTANTIQNDRKFKACHWTAEAIILQQLELLLESFSVDIVKIGIIENLQVLNKVISMIMRKNKEIKIIWDPVLKSSGGFEFQKLQEFQKDINTILENIFVVTPNFNEVKIFYTGLTVKETIRKISGKTNLYLKGGHRTVNIGLDELFTTKEECFSLEPVRIDCSEKHGSGCILSSALAAHLALGKPLPEAARKSKIYIEEILASNKALLAYHNL